MRTWMRGKQARDPEPCLATKCTKHTKTSSSSCGQMCVMSVVCERVNVPACCVWCRLLVLLLG
jgi:hypothetical protein